MIDSFVAGLRHGTIEVLRSCWRRLAPLQMRQAVGRALRPLVDESTLRLAKRSRGVPGQGRPAIVGFFNGTSGIALSAQLASRALDNLGIEHLRIDVGDLAAPKAPERISASSWMIYLNPPELLHLLAAWGPQQLKGSRFGYWAWELPEAPRSWRRTAAILDGVVVPSAFTAAALAGAQCPVSVSPHPLIVSEFAPYVRARDFKDNDEFIAVCLFDYKSSVARKNPLGAISAFSSAFGHDPSARLIVKTQNASFAPDLALELRTGAGFNVEFIDEIWDRPRLLTFLAKADVLISLHRAEGFGLSIAEAMLLGTPTIATGWSGSVDFTSDETACLVPFERVAVEDPQRIYRGQWWAEPDISVAAQHLRRLRSDWDFAQAISTTGRAKVADLLGPENWYNSLPLAFRSASGSRLISPRS